MNSFIDDENIEEFRGGTLQLNTNRSTDNTFTNGNISSASSTSRQQTTTEVEPAVLSGHDFVSPITSTSSPDNNGHCEGTSSHVLPQYNLPFAFINAKDYFAYRTGLVESAIDECTSTLIFPNQDGRVIGSWLLTEISLWDTEKERLIILTDKAIINVKYDFIALKQLEFRKVSLEEIDTLAIGDLIYPPASLVPRINGLATGVSSVVRDCILDRFSRSTAPANEYKNQQTDTKDKFGPIDLKYFEPSNRNMRGVRAMWNRGQPISFMKKWNPFDKNIPMTTLSSHPLFWHKENCGGISKDVYDIEHFAQALIACVEAINNGRESQCIIHYTPIVLPNYVGLTSVVHNKNALGFFKVRGKFSF